MSIDDQVERASDVGPLAETCESLDTWQPLLDLLSAWLGPASAGEPRTTGRAVRDPGHRTDTSDRVANDIDALDTESTGLRSAPGGTAAMAHLAAEFDQKLHGSGNGNCNRPSQLGCQFKSIGESCAYFSTIESFTPVLEAQGDHAADRDQHHRVECATIARRVFGRGWFVGVARPARPRARHIGVVVTL